MKVAPCEPATPSTRSGSPTSRPRPVSRNVVSELPNAPGTVTGQTRPGATSIVQSGRTTTLHPAMHPKRPGEGVGAAPVRNLHPVRTLARKVENGPKIEAP